MDEIIPPNDTMPAPSSLKADAYILGVLKDYPHLLSPFRQILKDLDQKARELSDKGFSDLDRHQKTEALTQFENTHNSSFTILKNFVYESYYLNETVWKLIGYEPHPTLSAGPKMEPFDLNLLERVKKLPPFYIETDG